MKSIYLKRGVKIFGTMACMLLWITKVTGQDVQMIKGMVVDAENNQPISYATVALYALNDSTLITGTLTQGDGSFELDLEQKHGQYMLAVNFVGYNPWTTVIEQGDSVNREALTVYMQTATIQLDEAVVVSDRIRAEKSFNKTTFFVNKKMLDASNTGLDIFRHIPGAQIDFMQNVKLEGSPNVLILVDGKERDKNFLLQLNAKQVDKIEIINTPGANFDGSATGIINVVLKKDKNRGFSGNVHLDIPVRKKEMYLFPLVNLNLGLKNMNLYGSYKGDIGFFDLVETTTLSHFLDNALTRQISTLQYLRQENWEHSFAYGMDYFMSEKNVFNFYANHRIYSNESDGQIIQKDNDDLYWFADKEETDMNHSGYYSMYYKHLFDKEGHELSMDVNYYRYKRDNTTLYRSNQEDDDNEDFSNHLTPKQWTYGLKFDYTRPVTESIRTGAGIKLAFTEMEERWVPEFNYYDHLVAAYGTITYKKSKFTVNTGLRVERSVFGINDISDFNRVDWLPNAVVNYQLNQKQTLKLTYARKIARPYIHQLNPTVYVDDPFTMRSGNENLIPTLNDHLTLDYAVLLGTNYLSTQLFYKNATNIIGNLSFLNDVSILESRFNSLGTLQTYGIQLTSALKLGPAIDLSGYFKFFGESAEPNDLARENQVEPRDNAGVEFGMSSAISFKYAITASVAMQYSSPSIDIQNKSYDDFIYFITLDKAIKKNFKFGVSLAPLFVKEYTYRGLETKGAGFKLKSTGDIRLPRVPLFFKVSYQFASGKSNRKIEREKEVIDNKVKTGF